MMDSVGLPAANARPHLICLRRPGELQGSDLAETEGKIGLQSLGQVESMMTFVAVHIELRRKREKPTGAGWVFTAARSRWARCATTKMEIQLSVMIVRMLRTTQDFPLTRSELKWESDSVVITVLSLIENDQEIPLIAPWILHGEVDSDVEVQSLSCPCE